MERPPTGLEEEIRYFYHSKGRLRSVIEHARRLMSEGKVAAASQSRVEEEGENEEMWNADAMGSLTMGAILTLEVSWKSDSAYLRLTASAQLLFSSVCWPSTIICDFPASGAASGLSLHCIYLAS